MLQKRRGQARHHCSHEHTQLTCTKTRAKVQHKPDTVANGCTDVSNKIQIAGANAMTQCVSKRPKTVANRIAHSIRYASSDPLLHSMLVGVRNRQIRSVLIDTYANAFNYGNNRNGHQNDYRFALSHLCCYGMFPGSCGGV